MGRLAPRPRLNRCTCLIRWDQWRDADGRGWLTATVEVVDPTCRAHGEAGRCG